MSEKIKVPKVLVDFYKNFIDNYYMSQLAVKLEEKCKLPRMFSTRDKIIKNGILDYIEENGFESTVETIWAMYLNGYEVEDEVQKYKIVFNDFYSYLDERADSVLWYASGEWILKPDDFFVECDSYKKTFTAKEISKNFPALVDNAVKVN